MKKDCRFWTIFIASVLTAFLYCRSSYADQAVNGEWIVDNLEFRLRVPGDGDSRPLFLSILNRSQRSVALLRCNSSDPAFVSLLAEVKPALHDFGVQQIGAAGDLAVGKYVLRPGQAYTWTLEITTRTLQTGTQNLRFLQDGDYQLTMVGFVRLEGYGITRLTSNSVTLHFGDAQKSMRPSEAMLSWIDLSGTQAVLNVGAAEGIKADDIYAMPAKAACNNWLFTVTRTERHSSNARIDKIIYKRAPAEFDACGAIPFPRPGTRVVYSGQRSSGAPHQ